MQKELTREQKIWIIFKILELYEFNNDDEYIDMIETIKDMSSDQIDVIYILLTKTDQEAKKEIFNRIKTIKERSKKIKYMINDLERLLEKFKLEKEENLDKENADKILDQLF